MPQRPHFVFCVLITTNYLAAASLVFGIVVLGAIQHDVYKLNGLDSRTKTKSSFVVGTSVLNLLWCLTELAGSRWVPRWSERKLSKVLRICTSVVMSLFWFVSFCVCVDLGDLFANSAHSASSQITNSQRKRAESASIVAAVFASFSLVCSLFSLKLAHNEWSDRSSSSYLESHPVNFVPPFPDHSDSPNNNNNNNNSNSSTNNNNNDSNAMSGFGFDQSYQDSQPHPSDPASQGAY